MPELVQYILLGLWAASFVVYAWTEGKDHKTMLGACFASLVSPLIYLFRLVCVCFQFIGEILVGLFSALD